MSLGEAAVDVVADTSKFEGGLKSGVGKAAKILGGIAAGVGIVGAAVGGLALKGGLDRALNIEDAQAKLKGLGHDTQAIETIMDSALSSVRGTAFGLDAAAGAAASAVAAGIAPGTELTRVLGLTADAATIMGRSFGDSGAIVNKILASNRVSMEEVNQLHDAGLPILSMLADEYGVTAEAMRKMISDGVVGSEDFLAAMENNIAGAALESGATVRGSFSNMVAALSRVGEKVVGPLLPVFSKVFGGITGHLDTLATTIGEKVVPFISAMADAFMEGEGIADSFMNTLGVLTGGAGVGSIFDKVRDIVQNVFSGIVDWLSTGGISQILNTILQARMRLWDAAMQLFPAILEALIAFLPQLLQFITGQLIPQLLEFILTGVPLLLETAITLFTQLVDAVVTILPVLIETLIGEVLPQVLETVLGMIPDLLDTALNLFMMLVEAVVTVLPDLLDTLLTEVLPNLLTTILSMLPGILQTAITVFFALVTGLLDVLPDLISTLIGQVLPELLATLIGMIPELIETAITVFLSLVEGILGALPEIIGVIVTELIPAIAGAIGGLGTALFDAGVNAMGELLGGVKKKAAEVVNWVKDNVVGAIKNLWPFSPAKEGPFAGRGSPFHAGQNVMSQFAEGLERGRRAVEDAALSATGMLQGAMAGGPALAGAGGDVILNLGGVHVNGDISREKARDTGEALVEGMLNRLSRARVVR